MVIMLMSLALGCSTPLIIKKQDTTPTIQCGIGLASSIRAYMVLTVPEFDMQPDQSPGDTGASQTAKDLTIAETPPAPALPEAAPQKPVTPPAPALPEAAPQKPVTPPAPALPEAVETHTYANKIPEEGKGERAYRFLYFKTRTCGYCVLFEKGSKDSNGTVIAKAYYDWFKLGKWSIGPDESNHIQEIYADENPSLAIKYGVDSYPTFILIKNNVIIKKFVGYTKGETLVKAYNGEK